MREKIKYNYRMILIEPQCNCQAVRYSGIFIKFFEKIDILDENEYADYCLLIPTNNDLNNM
jgi:hypothetical protein